MRIDSKLTLDISDKDGADIQKLCQQLTYPNPKYHEAKRLGFSTYGLLPSIQNYSISPGGLSLATTRGEINKIRKIWPNEWIGDWKVSNKYPAMRYVNGEFDLDVRQLRAVKAVAYKRQGIIHASTSAGKSAIIMAMIAARNTKTIVIVHRKILLEQLLKDARGWLKGCTIGQIGDGKCEPECDVVFAIDKSLEKLLLKKPTLREEWGMVIQDECHLSPCGTFQNIINKLDAPLRYGLTGTLKRKDGMEFMIRATYGEVIATITKDELLDADRVSPVETNIIDSEAEVDPAFFDLPTTKRWQAIDKSLHENVDRQEFIMEHVADILIKNPQARIVVLSRYVDPCYQVGKMISDHHISSVTYVTGKETDQTKACGDLESGRKPIMCATIGCFSTGVNIPNLTDIILISPIFNNELLIHQIRGRLMRKSEGKTHGTLHFIWDMYVFPHRNLNRFKSIMNK